MSDIWTQTVPAVENVLWNFLFTDVRSLLNEVNWATAETGRSSISIVNKYTTAAFTSSSSSPPPQLSTQQLGQRILPGQLNYITILYRYNRKYFSILIDMLTCIFSLIRSSTFPYIRRTWILPHWQVYFENYFPEVIMIILTLTTVICSELHLDRADVESRKAD